MFATIKLARWDRESIDVRVWRSEIRHGYPVLAVLPEEVLIHSLDSKHKNNKISDKIENELVEKLKSFGISINPLLDMPLYKEHTYLEPFPYDAIVNSIENPNIIIITMESLSASFVNSYGSVFDGLTPNIDSFSEIATRVYPFYNSSFPTINSLVSLLCSYAPPFSHADWDTLSNLEVFNVLCLAESLKNSGYKSYIITHGDPYFANQKPFFEYNGTDEAVGFQEIRDTLNESPNGRLFGGYSDTQMMRYFIKELKNSAFEEPFTVTISTADLHPTFKLPEDYSPYKEANNNILDLVYTSDKALGLFLDYFKNSNYFNNTVLIVTADHPIVPAVEYQKLVEGKTEMHLYDEIPLFIYDPIHVLPREINITSSSVDLLPSILHLLGVNVPNPFEGRSIFELKARLSSQNILGSHSYNLFYRYNDENHFFNSGNYECDNQTNSSHLFDQCDYISWWKYKRWLTITDRLWNH